MMVELGRLLAGFRLVGVLLSLALLSASTADARPPFSSIAIDARNGSVIFSNDPDGLRHPASLTKMMTLYIVFQELKAGRIQLSTPLTVSRRATGMQPSKLGVRAGSTISVEQAIKALVIKSANDVAATIGENLGGTESAFATRMTETARNIGMSRTTYKNASGLPNPAQVTTARDQATLALRLMRDFPQYYPYFRLQGFTFNGRTIRTHNRLVGRYPGTDGIKTGYTNASGFNLVTSTRRGDKRLVGVVLGSTSAGRRNVYMMDMLTRAFPKARDGNTVAALAGSSKGAVDPLAMATLAGKVTAAAETREPDPKDQVKLAEVAADAAADEAQVAEAGGEDEADLEDTTSSMPAASEGPRVLEARVADDVTWTIQIGVYKNKAMAETALNKLLGQKIPEIIGKPAKAVVARRNGRMQYRARFGGFDQGSAEAACEELAKINQACLPVSPRL